MKNQMKKLHIGTVEVSIPKEIEPSQDIAPKEEKYVHELLAAYADFVKSGDLLKPDLDSLPTKHKRNFSDQRINYYSACLLTALFENLYLKVMNI